MDIKTMMMMMMMMMVSTLMLIFKMMMQMMTMISKIHLKTLGGMKIFVRGERRVQESHGRGQGTRGRARRGGRARREGRARRVVVALHGKVLLAGQTRQVE